MNKKGFTLVELIVVIAVVLILSVIVTPKVMDVINKNRDKSYREIERRLEEAAAKYVVENYFSPDQEFITILKDDLIDKNYIGEIYDLKDNSVCDASIYVSNLNEIPSFNVHLKCNEYETE